MGITEEVEQFGLKGNKKKRGKKLDEDFIVSVFDIRASCAVAVLTLHAA